MHVPQVSATALLGGEAARPQQMFLALTHRATGTAAHVVGKAGKKGSQFTFLATHAAVEKQIGRQARTERGGAHAARAACM